jgi:hypothetical protein
LFCYNFYCFMYRVHLAMSGIRLIDWCLTPTSNFSAIFRTRTFKNFQNKERWWVWTDNFDPAHGEVYSIQHNVIMFVWFSAVRWFSPCTLISSTNKTNHHNIIEILLKVALNAITLTHLSNSVMIITYSHGLLLAVMDKH